MPVEIESRAPRAAAVTCEIRIDAPRSRVYRAWFDDTHEWFFESEASKHATPTRCEGHLGGRFYIELPDGGFNLLGEVTMVKPGAKIRIRGDYTMPDAVLMNTTIAFVDDGSATVVRIDHRMIGAFADDAPASFEEGWMHGLNELKRWVERSG